MAVSARNRDIGILLMQSNGAIWYNSRYQLLVRFVVTVATAISSALYLGFPYGLLMRLGGSYMSDALGAECNQYFREIPEVHQEYHLDLRDGENTLLIRNNDQAKQLAIWEPVKPEIETKEITNKVCLKDGFVESNTSPASPTTKMQTHQVSSLKERSLRRRKKKPQVMKFSEFKDMPEPEVLRTQTTIERIKSSVEEYVNNE